MYLTKRQEVTSNPNLNKKTKNVLCRSERLLWYRNNIEAVDEDR